MKSFIVVLPGAPPLDFVFTVCDNAAGEACPVWPGQPMTAHWGVPDPAEARGTPAEIALAFKDAYRMLHQRIAIFVDPPFEARVWLAASSGGGAAPAQVAEIPDVGGFIYLPRNSLPPGQPSLPDRSSGCGGSAGPPGWPGRIASNSHSSGRPPRPGRNSCSMACRFRRSRLPTGSRM
jgi:hypothetical protein